MTDVMTPPSETFADLFEATGESLSNGWYRDHRRTAMDAFRAQGIPTARHEEWRYTSLARLTENTFVPASATSDTPADLLRRALLPGLDAHVVVFVDGRWNAAASQVDALPAGVTLLPLAEALEKKNDLVYANLGMLSRRTSQPLEALAEALANDGVVLHIARNAALDKPLHLVFLTTDAAEPTLAATRHLVVADSGAQATILETHLSDRKDLYAALSLTEWFLADNANIDHYLLQQEGPEAVHLASRLIRLDRSATMRSHCIDFGGSLVRHTLFGKLDGEGCEAILNGLYMLRGTQHVDTSMWVEHCQENIPSHELYKGIMDDSATAAFTGRIYVHPQAQKTDAKQTNQNLLLSDNARVTTRPQLEIYADDVKCTHGATIGQLDEVALFYLKSRGMDHDSARRVLIHAFASDITERIRIEPLRLAVEDVLTERLGATT